MNRPLVLQVLRWVLVLIPIVALMLVGRLTTVTLAVAAALVAYDGPFRRSSAVMIGVLVVLEVLTSMQPGVLSLPYAVTIALLRALSTLVALPMPTTSVSWSVGTFLRMVVVAGIVVLASSVGAALMQSWVYGAGYTGIRIGAALEPWVVAQTCAIAALLVGALYRVDVPFTRRTI